MSKFMNLPVEEIVMDTKTQGRVSMDLELVETYAGAMMAGDTFPAIVCFQEPDSNDPILADGWYRTMAAKQAGIDELLAEVIEGDLDDAILHAAGANASHGLRRSNEDKRKAVNMLLDNPKWTHMSNRAIADAAGVDKDTVGAIRDERVEKSPTERNKGGTIVGKDGKTYQADANKKKKEKPKKVERSSLDKLKEMSKIYLKLPREPGDAAAEMAKDDQCLSAEQADCIAWWFSSYAKSIREYTDDEDFVINFPDPTAK